MFNLGNSDVETVEHLYLQQPNENVMITSRTKKKVGCVIVSNGVNCEVIMRCFGMLGYVVISQG